MVAFSDFDSYFLIMVRLISSAILIVIVLYAYPLIACNGTDPLFSIERSKNSNVVHYDACLVGDTELSASDPVKVYWTMKSGEREGLTWLEERYAYGIRSEGRLSDGGLEISLAAFARKMLVTKIDGRYRVVVPINGQRSILEKIYVECTPGLLGLPKVRYADFLGRTLATGAPIVERVKGNGPPSE